MEVKGRKAVQISILARVYGNVNADEVIGTRITLKKMYSTAGEVLPFVSSRALKYSIRQALKERGYDIDPFVENPDAVEALRLSDTGRPDKFVDNDLFGYMVTRGRREQARRRQAPISFSYLRALRDTSVVAEFAARFPRQTATGSNPVPFEVEVADFIGRLNCLIYDYIGDFTEDKKQAGAPSDLPAQLPIEERKKRLKDFLEILLTPSYILPRRTNSLNVPEYYVALISLSHGAMPIYQYLDYKLQEETIDIEKLNMLANLDAIKNKKANIYLIDYKGIAKGLQLAPIPIITVQEAIQNILAFFFSV
ncbi:MAG: type I-B CRISPR-associated protein Cas7/Cst2/DevR [Candidatus Bathyarchaeia archaeon]|jgi:CRISPR-associated autoregulator DevR family|nr:type I-B CRISPR-associated protein Cas7/Cst2/DevR [Candidatus Bathyarchaeota archaeon A05DMB-3]